MKKIISLLILLIILISSTQIQATADKKTKETVKQSTATNKVEDNKEKTVSQKINDFFVPVVKGMSVVLFWDPVAAMRLHDPVIYDDKGNPVLDEDGGKQEFEGTIANMFSDDHGIIRCEALRSLKYSITFRPVDCEFDPSEGDEVKFFIEFNHRGPVAVNVSKR